ncbi:hypothetical protein GIB67_034275 [Kingdonia uniflora]|uniref:SAM domain-containing protein n=1 Tax=Kingdonia uniflora TaxID=39325 RepID=A0A7J7NS11_9MAGN|nr:hypothetical protein GIB67_034275 [Kingdonia uniflora]
MAKAKHAHLAASKTKPSYDSKTENGEDEWVIVKKQKITILIPPLVPELQNPTTGQIQIQKSRKKLKSRKQVLDNKGTQKTCSADEQNKSALQIDERTSVSAGLNHATNKLHQPVFNSPPPGVPQSLIAEATFGSSMSCISVCGVLQKNRKMRAFNLERKLMKAGGVSPWLMSLGLAQLEQIFRKKNVKNIQLLSLTMEKLKDMGADAVGPRRKLIHAIDCLSQSYCFRASLGRPMA